MSTMLIKAKQGAEKRQDNSFDTGILEQGYSQLPAEGKIHLKDYLQNLVSLQNTMAKTVNEERGK